MSMIELLANSRAGKALKLLQPPSAAPSPPYDVFATAGGTSGAIDVQWMHRQPAVVDSFLIVLSGGASTTVSANGLARQSVRMTGQTNGVPQTATVYALNAAGAIIGSPPSNAASPTALPASLFPVPSPLLFMFLANQLTGLADGAAVAQLTDFSGNGYHAASEAAGATFKANWRNGKPSVTIPGTGARFTTKGSGLISGMHGPRQTIYILYSALGAPNPGGVAGDRILAAETPYTALANSASLGFAIATGYATPGRTAAVVDRSQAGNPGSGIEYASALTALNSPILGVVQRPGSAEWNGVDSNILLMSAPDLRPWRSKNRALGTFASNFEDTGWTIGSSMGGRFNQHANIDLAALMIFSGTHTPSQRAAIKAYLATIS